MAKTKAERIWALHAKGKSTREIAKRVMGLADDAPHNVAASKMAYVRTVAQRKNGRGMTASAKRWFHDKYRNDADFRSYRAKISKAWRLRKRADAAA